MDLGIGQSDPQTPRGVARLSQGTLTDKALTELRRMEALFLEEAVKLRERRGSWDRLALLYDAMDALSAELISLCRVLGLLSAWVPQVRDGEPTLAVLDGDLVDPGVTSLWKFPTLREAIGFLDDQRVLSWPEFLKLSEADRQNAFSVPPVTKLETLNVLKGALVDSFAKGESVEKFRKKAEVIVGAQTSAIERTYRTKSKHAYLQGVEVLTRSPRVRDRFPWVKYVATEDIRTRPTHRAMDGKIARADSPEAAEFRRLQEEYNCRCTLIPLTDAQAHRQGADVPEEPKDEPPRDDPPLVGEARRRDQELVQIREATLGAFVGDRVAITGGPRTGKTTMSKLFESRGYVVKHTDDLIADFDWSAASEQASRWFDAPGQICVEGVAVPRALRKFLARSNAKPIDRLLILDGAMVPQTAHQRLMTQGIETVLREIIPKLKARGVNVIRLPKGVRDA